MQTNIASRYENDKRVQAAENILRKCVHCGFCLATCPTYNILGDELDSPRGRIYQIKQVLEGDQPSAETREHLDRCLLCRNCETTCPSGVEYGQLLDVGRQVVESQTERPLRERWMRSLVKAILPYPSRIGPLVKMGQLMRPLLPARIAASVPPSLFLPSDVADTNHPAGAASQSGTTTLSRKMLLLDGCVQPSMAPSTNVAARRVLQRVGIDLVSGQSVCCGAINHHLSDEEGGLEFVRKNIDLWWSWVEQGVEAIVITASGCGTMVKDYAHLLAHDPQYAEKARKISELTKDLSEVVAAELEGGAVSKLFREEKIDTERLRSLVDSRSVALEERTALSVQRETRDTPLTVAFHPPCSLQHAQKLGGTVEKTLQTLGVELVEFEDSQECCGSAGTYSIFQPRLSSTLKAKKLSNIHKAKPSVIATANIGCQLHLQSASKVPVVHWIELLEAGLPHQL